MSKSIDEMRTMSADWNAQQKRDFAVSLVKELPASDQAAAVNQITAGMPAPSGKVRDVLWIIAIVAFALVLVGSASVLFVTYFVSGNGKTDPQTILAVFTAVMGFLTGVFVPSPTAQQPAGGGS